MADQDAILVCTVGGSHQPILTALKARRWDRVVFVCTPQTGGQPGSAAMIGTTIVPADAGLGPDRWEIVEVPPDDTDAAFALLVDKLRALARDEAERLGEPHELPQLPTALPVLWAGPATGAQPAISVASRRA